VKRISRKKKGEWAVEAEKQQMTAKQEGKEAES